MKQFLRKLYNKFIKRLLPKSIRKKLKQSDSKFLPIVKYPEKLYAIVYHIKDATWETMCQPETYHLLKQWTLQQYHQAQGILQIEECNIRDNSDTVETKEGIVWDKAYTDIFSKMIPMDNCVLKHTLDDVWIRKAQGRVDIEGDCISLLGVHARLWAHFLVQFLPKLYYAEEAGFLDREVTIIVPKYTDAHVIKMVQDVLDRHPKIRKYEVEDLYQVDIHCERLYYIPTASTLSNHAEWIAPFDIVIPKRVLDVLEKKLIKPLIEKAKDVPSPHEKIYLVRRGMRSMSNIDEVEQYFREQGFYFVEPHKMSLVEKVSLFQHAKILAGPQSSAWINILFCKDAKGLMFAPLCRAMDAYFGYINNIGMSKLLILTGEDQSLSIHADYHISLTKINEAYKYLIHELYETDNNK